MQQDEKAGYAWVHVRVCVTISPLACECLYSHAGVGAGA